MTQLPDQGPVIIAPPRPVVAAAVLICAQAVGVVVLAIVITASGLSSSAQLGQLLAQAAYYLIVAVAMAGCGLALLKGRRWGRTPTIVVQLVLVAIGYWLAFSSSRLGWGLSLMVLAVVTAGPLFSRSAIAWIKAFPALFGPTPDQ